MTDPTKTAVARPMPRPTAQVAPYVEALGAEMAVTFLLAFGGADLYLAKDPKGNASHMELLGYDKAKALAAHPALAERQRVPIANRWLAAMLMWQGHSKAGIARQLRATDVSVRRWLKEWHE